MIMLARAVHDPLRRFVFYDTFDFDSRVAKANLDRATGFWNCCRCLDLRLVRHRLRRDCDRKKLRDCINIVRQRLRAAVSRVGVATQRVRFA